MKKMRLIDANAAADKIMRDAETHADEIRDGTVEILTIFARALRDETKFPTVEAEPVQHGKWDEIYPFSEHGIPMASYECTNCGNDIERQRGVLPTYCEFCGARMGGCDDKP